MLRHARRDGRTLSRTQAESAPEPVESAGERLIEKYFANAAPAIGGARALEVCELVRDESRRVLAATLAQAIAPASLEASARG